MDLFFFQNLKHTKIHSTIKQADTTIGKINETMDMFFEMKLK